MNDTISRVAWPMVVLISLLVFREPLKAFLYRIKTLTVGKSLTISAGDAEIDNKSTKLSRSPVLATINEIKWANSGNLYWLGHDLMWTIQIALRGAPLARILHGLQQSNHHLEALNLTGTPGGIKLARLTAEAEKSYDYEWDVRKRDAFATAVDDVLDDIGVLVEMNQPGFTPGGEEVSSAARVAGR